MEIPKDTDLLAETGRKVLAGFVNRSTQPPSSMAGRQVCLADVEKYFAKYPDWESKKPALSAALLKSCADPLELALKEGEAHTRTHKLVVKERNKVGAQVRARLRNIIKELAIVLDDHNARWEDFGLGTPAAEHARKPVRDERSRIKAEAGVVKKQATAIRKAEVAKVRAEKSRVRADKALATANQLRAQADKWAEIAEALFTKAEISPVLASRGSFASSSRAPDATESIPTGGAVELVG